MGEEEIALLVIMGVFMFFMMLYVGIPLILWGISVTMYKQNELLMDQAKKRLSGSWGGPIGAIAIFMGVSMIASVVMQFGGFFLQIIGAMFAPLFSAVEDNLAAAAVIMLIAVLVFVAFLIIMIVAQFLVYSGMTLGYTKYMILFTNRIEVDINELFLPFKSKKVLKTAFVTYLLKSIYIGLWSLLFVIPGVVAAYSYATTMFTLAENPNLRPSQALEMSKKMMYGHRAELFWLHCRFMGWGLLTMISGGIGVLWFYPYIMTTNVLFYQKLKRKMASPEERIQY